MRKLKVLELFSGTGSISKAFEERGHETVRIDWDEKMEADWHVDIGKLTAEKIVKRYGWFDVIWASPECTTYSVAAISKHRRKDPEWGGVGADFGIREAVRQDQRQPHANHQGHAGTCGVHREPEGCFPQDGLDSVDSTAHGNVLPVPDRAAIGAATDEADRHLLHGAQPEVQATVPER